MDEEDGGMRAAARTRWWHGQGGGMDKAGDMDVGATRMRGTTEGGRMRAAAWTRRHRRGAQHGQEGQVGGMNEGWQMVANGGERGGGTDEEGGTDDGMALLGRVMSHPFAVVFRREPPEAACAGKQHAKQGRVM